jgi:hypothetical protein
LRDGKTRFRAGEPIRLVLTFTTARSGYSVDTYTTLPVSPTDEIDISPDTGVFHWLDLYGSWTPDVMSFEDPPPATVEVVLPLNWWVRIDRAGDYTVCVRTRRLHEPAHPPHRGQGAAVPVTTNAVTFHVDLMTDDEEAAEVRRLSALVDSTPPRDLTLQTERCEDLSFLSGDAAAREKVRQYLHPERHVAGNWERDLSMGFFISKNPSIILNVFEDALNDLSRPARTDWIYQAAAIRGWINQLAGGPRQSRMMPRSDDPIRQEYVDRQIASLRSREGRSRLDTALTLVMIAGGRKEPIADVVRQVIVEGFESFSTGDQVWLVSERWRDIRDPALAPALRRLLTVSPAGPPAKVLAALADIGG